MRAHFLTFVANFLTQFFFETLVIRVGHFVRCDVLSLGHFVPGTFCPWDVLSLGSFVLGRFILGRFVLGRFVLGHSVLGRLVCASTTGIGIKYIFNRKKEKKISSI